MKSLLKGFSYPFRGFVYLTKNHLWPSCLPAIFVSFLLFAALLLFLIMAGGNFNNWVAGLIPTVEGNFWNGAMAIARETVKVVLYIVEFLLLLVLLNGLGAVFAGPFLDSLSEKIEIRLGKLVLPRQSWWASLSIGLKNGLQGFISNLVVWLVLLPLNFIPLLGSGIYFLASVSCTAIFNALQYLSYPLDRRMVAYREQKELVKTNKALCLGFGLGVNLLTCIPLVQLIFLPLSAAGGTLLFTDMWAAGRLPASVGEKCKKQKIEGEKT